MLPRCHRCFSNQVGTIFLYNSCYFHHVVIILHLITLSKLILTEAFEFLGKPWSMASFAWQVHSALVVVLFLRRFRLFLPSWQHCQKHSQIWPFRAGTTAGRHHVFQGRCKRNGDENGEESGSHEEGNGCTVLYNNFNFIRRTIQQFAEALDFRACQATFFHSRYLFWIQECSLAGPKV